MNISNVELVIYTVFIFLIMLLIAYHTMQYIHISRYEKRIRSHLAPGVRFDYDIMHNHYDFNMSAAEAADEMALIKFNGG